MASNASDVQIKKIMDNAPPEFLAKIMALYEKTNKEQNDLVQKKTPSGLVRFPDLSPCAFVSVLC